MSIDYKMILQIILPLMIIAGSIVLFFSLFIIRKIIYSARNNQSKLFWEIIALVVVFFLSNYIVISYFVYQEVPTFFIILISIICLAGAFFVYFILKNSLYVINEISKINNLLVAEMETQNEIVVSLNEKSQAIAKANARMTQLYLDLEEAKIELEDKERVLQKKNEETTKVNSALANANSNISHLFVELEEVKDQLMEKKEELLKKNKMLSKSNILLADTFKKFVPEQFLDKIAKEGIEKISTGYAERTNLTVLFSDIRFFTKISEEKDPRDILTILNKYFTHMSHEIYTNNGFIDKFIGDAIMALFEEIPGNVTVPANNAVNAAIGMQHVLKTINNEIMDITNVPLKTGIGIHSGEVILGTVGLEHRMESTVLGNTVNIASRIEGLTKIFDAAIILSKSTVDLIEDPYKYQYRNLGFTEIRGIQSKIQLFEFFDGDEEETRLLKFKTIENFNRAATFISESDFEHAMEEYKNALRVFPDDPASQYLISQCEYELGKE